MTATVYEFKAQERESPPTGEPACVLRIDRRDNQRHVNSQALKGARILHDMRFVFDRGCTMCQSQWIAPSPFGACPRCGAAAEQTLSTAEPRFLNYVRS